MRDLRARRLGGHVEFDRVHEHHGENVEVLDDVKTSDDPVDHLADTCFGVKNFADRDMPIFLLQTLGLEVGPSGDFVGIAERILLGDVIAVFLLSLSHHPVFVDQFDDGKILPVMVL